MAFTRAKLEKAVSTRLNTDNHPLSYFYALKLWLRNSGKPALKLFNFLEKINLTHWLWFLLFLLFCRFLGVGLFKLKKEQVFNFNLLYIVGAAGFSSMGLSLLLLFTLQNLYGYLYQMVGLFFAVFMLGLALGGWLAWELIRKAKASLKSLLLAGGALTLYSFALPFLLSQALLFSLRFKLLLLTGLAGLLGGIIFPLAANLLLKNRETGNAAGAVNAADHLGASAGAYLTGIFLLPLLGTAATCYLIAGLNLISLIFISLLLINDKQEN